MNVHVLILGKVYDGTQTEPFEKLSMLICRSDTKTLVQNKNNIDSDKVNDT